MLRCCPRCPHREVIAVDLPGFGETAPLTGEVTRHTLTDAVQDFIKAEGLDDVDVVGNSMGARMVLEMARRGHAGSAIALDPGGFGNDGQLKLFNASIKASVALVRSIQPTLPVITRNPVGAPFWPEFSASFGRCPPTWSSPSCGVQDLQEPRRGSFVPRQRPQTGGLSRRFARSQGRIGWGRQDKVTLPERVRSSPPGCSPTPRGNVSTGAGTFRAGTGPVRPLTSSSPVPAHAAGPRPSRAPHHHRRDVAFAYTVTGTHHGPLKGHDPVGKAIRIGGVQIGRFAGGRLVERWGSSDQLGMLSQLGLAPQHELRHACS